MSWSWAKISLLGHKKHGAVKERNDKLMSSNFKISILQNTLKENDRTGINYEMIPAKRISRDLYPDYTENSLNSTEERTQ